MIEWNTAGIFMCRRREVNWCNTKMNTIIYENGLKLTKYLMVHHNANIIIFSEMVAIYGVV